MKEISLKISRMYVDLNKLEALQAELRAEHESLGVEDEAQALEALINARRHKPNQRIETIDLQLKANDYKRGMIKKAIEKLEADKLIREKELLQADALAIEAKARKLKKIYVSTVNKLAQIAADSWRLKRDSNRVLTDFNRIEGKRHDTLHHMHIGHETTSLRYLTEQLNGVKDADNNDLIVKGLPVIKGRLDSGEGGTVLC